jgi:hypothetical protein
MQASRTNRVTMETLALFVRYYLALTPPLPPDTVAFAPASGKRRYEGLIEALGQRLKKGRGPKTLPQRLRAMAGGARQGDLPATSS